MKFNGVKMNCVSNVTNKQKNGSFITRTIKLENSNNALSYLNKIFFFGLIGFRNATTASQLLLNYTIPYRNELLALQ